MVLSFVHRGPWMDLEGWKGCFCVCFVRLFVWSFLNLVWFFGQTGVGQQHVALTLCNFSQHLRVVPRRVWWREAQPLPVDGLFPSPFQVALQSVLRHWTSPPTIRGRFSWHKENFFHWVTPVRHWLGYLPSAQYLLEDGLPYTQRLVLQWVPLM